MQSVEMFTLISNRQSKWVYFIPIFKYFFIILYNIYRRTGSLYVNFCREPKTYRNTKEAVRKKKRKLHGEI